LCEWSALIDHLKWINPELLVCRFDCIEMIHIIFLIYFFNMWTSMYECLTVSAYDYFVDDSLWSPISFVWFIARFNECLNCLNVWIAWLFEVLECLNCLNMWSSWMYTLLEYLNYLNIWIAWMFELLECLNYLNIWIIAWMFELLAYLNSLNF
jgi:hypothetical protein